MAEGRQDVLTKEEVRSLADGSIYYAQEALDNHLIDQVGYFRDAVDLTEKLAGIRGARVIQYHEHYTIWQYLAAEGKTPSFKLDHSTVTEFTSPHLMYYWDGKK